jgi:hypothetical protein
MFFLKVSTVWNFQTLTGTLARISKGKRSLERRRHRWEDNIKMDLTEMECVDWIHVAQDMGRWCALANTAMDPLVP